MNTKRCGRCKTNKSKDNFYKNSSLSDGLSCYCRACVSEVAKANSLMRRFYGMRQRCYNPKHKEFKHYGAKLIGICKEWLDDPKIFCEWAKVNGFKDGLHIDRIDGNKGYSPDNCRFVTSKENNENLTTARWWYVHGVRYVSLTEATKALEMNRSTVGRWCKGYTHKGVFYPPKEGCYTVPKYTNLGTGR